MTARAWCFTLNNPDVEREHEHLCDGCPTALRYAVWQCECGERGTQHIQGYAEFAQPLRLAAVRRWLPRAHWERRRGTREQVREWCRAATARGYAIVRWPSLNLSIRSCFGRCTSSVLVPLCSPVGKRVLPQG